MLKLATHIWGADVQKNCKDLLSLSLLDRKKATLPFTFKEYSPQLHNNVQMATPPFATYPAPTVEQLAILKDESTPIVQLSEILRSNTVGMIEVCVAAGLYHPYNRTVNSDNMLDLQDRLTSFRQVYEHPLLILPLGVWLKSIGDTMVMEHPLTASGEPADFVFFDGHHRGSAEAINWLAGIPTATGKWPANLLNPGICLFYVLQILSYTNTINTAFINAMSDLNVKRYVMGINHGNYALATSNEDVYDLNWSMFLAISSVPTFNPLVEMKKLLSISSNRNPIYIYHFLRYPALAHAVHRLKETNVFWSHFIDQNDVSLSLSTAIMPEVSF